MYLMIEKNKLKERFKGTVASAIIEALDKSRRKDILRIYIRF